MKNALIFALVLWLSLLSGATVIQGSTMNATVPVAFEVFKDPCGIGFTTMGTETITYKREFRSKDLQIIFNCKNGTSKHSVYKGFYQ